MRPTFSSFDDLVDDVLRFSTESLSQNTTSSETDGWRHIDWKAEAEKFLKEQAAAEASPPPSSPVDVIVVRDRAVYLKRDDQLRLEGSQISGNKARKMLTLARHNRGGGEGGGGCFPSCIVSHGGPQSNAMLALAAVVHHQNEKLGLSDGDPGRKRFVYYTRRLPRFLRNQPSGNLFRAGALGMELVQVSPQEYSGLFGSEWSGAAEPPRCLPPPVPGDSVWIPQGGACGLAIAGTRLLAREILDFWSREGRGRPLSVCVPGGTCSTALLVHRAIQDVQSKRDEPLDVQVVVIPCVGDAAYARRQMMALNAQLDSASLDDIPLILPPAPDAATNYFGQSAKRDGDYFTFGEPHALILETFREMRDEHDVVLDLLYGAPAWTILLRHWRSTTHGGSPISGRQIMYVHSGGLEGISSQMLRYKYKNLIDLEEIQLPGRRNPRTSQESDKR
jgi:1-aminocyclopropane-1-carboxylate deaminase/D-cysteine desulfhydrase-like pyridoxal-dependent ACC family enzyme